MNDLIEIGNNSFELPQDMSEYECKQDNDNGSILPQEQRCSSSEKSLIQSWSEWVISKGTKSANKTNKNEFNKGRFYEEMGIAKAHCGNTTEALCLFDLALETKRQEYDMGNDDATANEALLSTLLNRARAFGKMDLLRSCSEYKEIIQMQEKARSPACIASTKKEDLFLAKTLLELAHVQCKRGDFTNGIPNFYAALNIRVGHLGTQHQDVAYVWYMIGKTYHIKRDYENAMLAYRNSLNIFTSDSHKKKNHALIQIIQRLVSDRTMLADISKKHWEDNATV